VINTRIFSGPQAGRNGVPNDARLWNDSCQLPGRQPQNDQERFEKSGQQFASHHQRSLSAPFKDHPDARVTDKASTFYYKKETIGQKIDFCNNRTLYVHGAPVDMFASHALRDMMSEVGTVESISYLHSNRQLGPAFLT
jgi:capsule polysaccharide modification protein KpsS